jgi:hypothetical protein
MPSNRVPVVLVHGAATTAAVWGPVLALLAQADPDLEVSAPERPCTGDLARETAWLAERARDALVVGVGGGATLGLALLAGGVPLAGALLHEPAVGSLVPGLLAHVAAGYERDGVPGFGAALYGPLWTPDMAPADDDAVARDFAMFRAFEPAAPKAGPGPAVVTVGADSPPIRHRAAQALADAYGLAGPRVPRAAHFVHHENPAAWVDTILGLTRTVAEG